MFHDKSAMFIDKTIGEPLAAKKVIPDFVLDGCHYKGSSISMVLTTEKYFELHPDKRASDSKVFVAPEPREWTPEQREATRRMTAAALWDEIQARKSRGESTSIAEGIHRDMIAKKFVQTEVIKSL